MEIMIRLHTVLVLACGLAVACDEAGGGRDEAARTPVPGAVTIRVIDDVNLDGVAQHDEPGVEGMMVSEGCYDVYDPVTTDANGEAAFTGGFDGFGEYQACIRVQRDFGWYVRSPAEVRVLQSESLPAELTFLVHDFGNTVTEVHGRAIENGLPLDAPQFSGTAGCVFAFDDASESWGYIAILVGSDVRPGCPSNGQEFSITMNGSATNARFALAPGDIVWSDFVVGDDSMRFHSRKIAQADVADAAGVLTPDCAEIIDGDVFVLASSVRKGCGEPGRVVEFISSDGSKIPAQYWQAGRVGHQPPHPVNPVVFAPTPTAVRP